MNQVIDAKTSFKELLESGDYLKPGELACGLKVSPGTVYAWVERGLIPFVRLGKCIRFDPADIQEWLKKKRKVARNPSGGGGMAKRPPDSKSEDNEKY